MVSGQRFQILARQPPRLGDEERPGAGAARGEDPWDVLALFPVHAALFGFFWLTYGEWWAYFALWAVPVLTVGAALNALRATLEHAGTDRVAHFLTFRSNPIERFFLAPFGFAYHFEHHCFMAVPYYHAAKAREYLTEKGALRDEMWVDSYLSHLRHLLTTLPDR